MTYCVGLKLHKGMIFVSDTRTNAGFDNVARFRKMYTWEVAGDRAINLMTAGNLATTQATVGLLNERTKAPENRRLSILEMPSMFETAQLVGRTLREVISEHREHGMAASGDFDASIIVGGQVGNGKPTMFMVYPEGNFIEVSDDTPFLQIGEIKYGRPILVRAHDPSMSFADGLKLLMLSFDSTMQANLSVGLPLDIAIYSNDTHTFSQRYRITENDAQYKRVSSGWSDALRSAFDAVPGIEVEQLEHASND